MDKTLVLLAAGMGSRYGGLKQLDQLGPHGETLMDYSIFDALRAGFTKIVFIIRHDIEEEFKRVIGSRYEHMADIAYAFQSLDDLPGGFSVPEGRTKPWGTGQAVYAAREIVKTPFAVINSDDFYGADGYRKLAKGLDSAEKNEFCMCGFFLRNTLSENGSVSRGICSLNADGTLKDVVEHTKIEKTGGKILSTLDDGSQVEFTGDEVVSMNMWGFQPSLFNELEGLFRAFLEKHSTELKSEFYIPFVADELVKAGKAKVNVLTSGDSWFGVTYKEDKPVVQNGLRALVKAGVYPENLFEK